jgi:hypothetical protein
MRKYIPYLILVSFTVSCTATKYKLLNEKTFLITEVSVDKTYGYSESNPVKVGGKSMEDGPLNERRFLNALTGPGGEEIKYERKGSCCAFDSKNGIMGMGLLDMYEITWQGQRESVTLYINMYDPGKLQCPVGLRIKGK